MAAAALTPESGDGPLEIRDEGGTSGEAFRLFVASVRDYAILMLDTAGRIVSWNAGAERIKGYSEAEILGRHFSVFYPPEDVVAGTPGRHLAEAAASGHLRYEGWRQRKDGSRFWADVVLTAIFDDDGELHGFGKVTRDLTERMLAERRLSHRSLHDELTGLPSRALLLDRLAHAVSRLERHPGRVAVLFVDLDRFKAINDTLGHDAGDDALVAVARRFTEAVRPDDTVARLSGDEFVVVCQDLREEAEATAIAERLVASLARPVTVGQERLTLTASIGIVLTADPCADPATMLGHADTAMYHAKRDRTAGRRFQTFSPEMRVQLDRRLELERDLPHVLDRGELSVVYQPVVALPEGRVSSFEVLARWQRPHEGAVPPNEFIPLAERTGAIGPIGAWVLERACRQLVSWQDQAGVRGIGVAVNVSARQLHERGLVEVLDRVLAATAVDPSRVCLELTESQVMTDAAASVGALTDLKRRGVTLSIDDFGTGYSSLSHLTRLPVDSLKIDRSFVAGLGAETPRGHDAVIVSGTIQLAHALGLSVVAEGVETARQHAELRELGCDYAQGWYFGRPQPPERIAVADTPSTSWTA